MSPVEEIVDLHAPFKEDVILEVRRSRMKPMPGLRIETGIDKMPLEGSVPVSFLGIEGDEHDPTFHGGREKAIHGYCCSHYPNWQAEYPEAASRFKAGGFGENFVVRHMNERNVCIGDIMSVGDDDKDGLLLQVSLPRQPCFKLNHRFQLKNFAPKTYALSRTGWYFRVLREGSVKAGDAIRLVQRPQPKWTVERVQEYLHRTQDDGAMNEELAAVEELGDESRGAFRSRVARQRARERREAAGGGSDEEDKWRDYRIVEKKQQTARIASFVLEAITPDTEERGSEQQLGAHARLKLPNSLLRTYSITSGDANRFELGIALEENSRGGSRYLHQTAKQGDMLQVGRITTDVKPAGSASSHVFIVGGIGITAFLALVEAAHKIHWETTVHLAVRSAAEMPFRERLDALGSDVVRVYDAARGERLDIPAVFAGLGWNSHVYVCGPRRMLDEAVREARARGLGEGDVHFEAFVADGTGDPFEVEVANRGKEVLRVGGEETLLEVLRRRFGEGDVASSCEVGNCGTCRVALKGGRVEHRGTALLEEEKGEALLSCVSRGVGRICIEI